MYNYIYMNNWFILLIMLLVIILIYYINNSPIIKNDEINYEINQEMNYNNYYEEIISKMEENLENKEESPNDYKNIIIEQEKNIDPKKKVYLDDLINKIYDEAKHLDENELIEINDINALKDRVVNYLEKNNIDLSKISVNKLKSLKDKIIEYLNNFDENNMNDLVGMLMFLKTILITNLENLDINQKLLDDINNAKDNLIDNIKDHKITEENVKGIAKTIKNINKQINSSIEGYSNNGGEIFENFNSTNNTYIECEYEEVSSIKKIYLDDLINRIYDEAKFLDNDKEIEVKTVNTLKNRIVNYLEKNININNLSVEKLNSIKDKIVTYLENINKDEIDGMILQLMVIKNFLVDFLKNFKVNEEMLKNIDNTKNMIINNIKEKEITEEDIKIIKNNVFNKMRGNFLDFINDNGLETFTNYWNSKNPEEIEHFGNLINEIEYKKNNFNPNKLYYGLKCKYIKNDCFYDILKKNGFKLTDDIKLACLIVPCTYENTEKEIQELENNGINDNIYKKNVRVFMLNNTDHLVSKLLLWRYLKNFYGSKIASTLLPFTWDLTQNEDIEQFKKDYDMNKVYITKNNHQRQQGLKIHTDLQSILDMRNKHLLVQELLQNPYLINGRKINLRVYVLVIRDNSGNAKVKVFNDGFLYYTKDLFKPNTSTFENNITTGYIDRKVYEENPLTIKDLKNYLDNPNRTITNIERYILDNYNIKLSDYIFSLIYKQIGLIFQVYENIVGSKNQGVNFQLYGVDVAIDDNLKPMVMEINKGPDITSKDERDGQVKRKLSEDILKSVGLINDDENNGFINVLELVNLNGNLVAIENVLTQK
jgi:hypothetical protein